MSYKKCVNGKDCFGNYFYHVVVDECISRDLADWLKESPREYSVLYINEQINLNGKKYLYKGSRDDFVGMIAVLNSSVLITSDKLFFDNLNYKKLLIDKKTNFDTIDKALNNLLNVEPCIESILFSNPKITTYLDLRGKSKFKKLKFRKSVQEFMPEIKWVDQDTHDMDEL